MGLMVDTSTIAGLIHARQDDENVGILSADGDLTHSRVVELAAQRGAWLAKNRLPGPFHIAVLSDNSVEYLLWLEAAALVGACVVGANTTHRGDELARDLAHTECQLLITSPSYSPLVAGLDLGPALGTVHEDNQRVLTLGSDGFYENLLPFEGARASDLPSDDISASTLGYLLFTSGTSGAPKAVKCSQGRLAMISGIVAQMYALTPDDVCYAAMPLFHSNALMAGWGPSLAGASAVAVPSTERFSASGFLPDVRRFGVTYFNYVGKPLSYILATAQQDDDAKNTLRQCFGNEAAPDDIDRFAQRFGCAVAEAYGSSEGGANVARTHDSPPGALGRAPEGTLVLDPETGAECPPAQFDESGRLLNAEACIGELVSLSGGQSFEGYWQNEEAMEARLRDGYYWTGDLAYRDEAGFFYFAGRDHDWMRVDGENFAAAPIERILQRHDDIVIAAVYAVPDETVGDQPMAAVEYAKDPKDFNPEAFSEFLSHQEDLGTKWAPKYIRVMSTLPKTATSKVIKKSLRAERWNTPERVWWRPTKDLSYVLLSPEEAVQLNELVQDRVL